LAVLDPLHSPYVGLALCFLLAGLLTQVLSNIAAVVVLAPVAIGVATQMHWSVYPFVLAVVVAVSATPMTPLANKVDILVMGPGGYSYADFVRIGVPLTVLLGAATVALLPVFFPLR
jgi:di/tricarboxylate transporter